MIPNGRLAETFALLTATLLLVFFRPRGISEGVWAALGAALCLLLGLSTPRDALALVLSAKDALLFLLALLALSTLLEESGFFAWAAGACARFARGNGHLLYLLLFGLGAVTSALLSLDTTAVILTPVVLAAVRRSGVPARPYVVATAFVANAGSLSFPISNLTNLLLAEHFNQGFLPFAVRMALPEAVALAVTFAALRLWFRAELPARFEGAGHPAPPRHPFFFRTALGVLGFVFAGYLVGPRFHLPPYVFAFAGSAVLAVTGAVTAGLGVRWVRRLSLGVFPFVMGLLVLVDALHAQWGHGGPSALLARWAASPTLAPYVAALSAAVASNVVNNLPTALFAEHALGASPSPALIYGTLLGTNLGPNATVFGSLATLLVLDQARRAGEPTRGRDLVALGLLSTPIVLFASAAALQLTLRLVH